MPEENKLIDLDDLDKIEDYHEFMDAVEELKDFAEYLEDSYGDACLSLCNIYRYPNYLSDEFHNAVVKEIKNQLKNFRENAKIVEYEETYTRKYKDLEWE